MLAVEARRCQLLLAVQARRVDAAVCGRLPTFQAKIVVTGAGSGVRVAEGDAAPLLLLKAAAAGRRGSASKLLRKNTSLV